MFINELKDKCCPFTREHCLGTFCMLWFGASKDEGYCSFYIISHKINDLTSKLSAEMRMGTEIISDIIMEKLGR